MVLFLTRRLLQIQPQDRVCTTCGEPLKTCTGHFGVVSLCLPVFHTGYFKQILNILQSICKQCSRILLPPAVRRRFLVQMRSVRGDLFLKKALIKQVLETCKKQIKEPCACCNAKNGTVKKIGYLQVRLSLAG